MIDGPAARRVFRADAEAVHRRFVHRAANLRFVGREIGVDLQPHIVTDDGDLILGAQMIVEEAHGIAAGADHLALRAGVRGDLVEEEDEVAIVVNALDFELRRGLGLRDQAAIGEVVDGVDRLLLAILADDEVVLAEAEHLIAARVGHDRVELHEIDVDLLAEWLRILLRRREAAPRQA